MKRNTLLIACLMGTALCCQAAPCTNQQRATKRATYVTAAESFSAPTALAKKVCGLVTDSAGSLLNNVSLKTLQGNRTLATTGYDGMFALDIADNDSLSVQLTADGCLPMNIQLSGRTRGTTQVWVMRRDNTVRTTYTGRTRGMSGRKHIATDEVMYLTSASYECKVVMPDGLPDMPAPTPGAIANSPASAGMLTAGEVNDFAKWMLWDSVLRTTLGQYTDHWRLNTRKRYTAQVTTPSGYPLANVPVSLTDNRGNTLYQARTDNTGRAELWDGLCEPTQDSKRWLLVDNQRIAAHTYDEGGLCTVVADEPCGSSNEADVVFLVDATGSMGDELRYLQAEITDVIARAEGAVPGLNIRTGALVYRDHQDEYLTRLSRLGDDIHTTQQFLQNQYAGGGGDYEEAIPEALMAALNTAGWNDNARTRILFLVLDAPCHRDSATLRLLHEQLLTAAAYGIRMVPVVCSGLDGSGELLLRSMALATNGTSFFLTDDSGIGETHHRPATDTLAVEHLNDMLVRTITQFCRMNDCTVAAADTAMQPGEQFVANPFETADLPEQPELLDELPLDKVLSVRPNPCRTYCLADLPMGCQSLYLVDISGKMLAALGSQPAATTGLSINVSGLSAGVYFLKAYYGGRWYTRKIIVG